MKAKAWALGGLLLGSVAVAQADTHAAIEHLKTQARNGHAPAMLALGQAFEHGHHGLTPNAHAANGWYTQAALFGDVYVRTDLAVTWKLRADNLSQGIGGKHDLALAAEWYHRAAKLGYLPAQVKMGDVAANGIGIPQNLLIARYWYQRAAKNGHPVAARKLQALNENSQFDNISSAKQTG